MLFSLPLILLMLVLIGAVSTAVFAWVVGRQRHEILLRVESSGTGPMPTPLLAAPSQSLGEKFAEWLADRTPETWADATQVSEKLLHAGFETGAATVVYTVVRVVFGILLPATVFVAVADQSQSSMLMFVGLGIAIGLLGPPAVLDRLVQVRQERLRRALPDALDLMVVCVEAGISLDAAILRVARDLVTAHPDLAAELLMINRKVNAGMPREDALNGLWQRTGMEELRGLAANMIQSERWGTSIAKVLRVNAETLRRKRKQAAEKKAAQATIKMMFPLVCFLLPALFVVILGPAILVMGEMFK